MYFVADKKYTRRVHRTMYSHLSRMLEIWKAQLPNSLTPIVFPNEEGNLSLLACEPCETYVEAQAIAIQKGVEHVLNCSTGRFETI